MGGLAIGREKLWCIEYQAASNLCGRQMVHVMNFFNRDRRIGIPCPVLIYPV